MTIWILALVMLGSCMALGHKLGAIRAAISFFGIILSELLAAPLSGLIKPLVPHLGVQNPVWLWVLPPAIMFALLLIIFKTVGQIVHHKIYVHYKHYTTDAQMGWWERMNHRLGLCVGTLNGLIYTVLLCSLIYTFSYWSTQIATSEEESASIRLLNRAGHDLEATGMTRVARAVEPISLPPDYFKMADLAGLLSQNPKLDDRLADYPAFVTVSQRNDFQELGRDANFQNTWQNHGRLGDLLGTDSARGIWMNREKAATLWTMVATNLDDLSAYLQTGTSAKFDEPVLGRWHFNVVSTLAMVSQSRPTFSSKDMQALRAIWTPAYAQTVLLASADGSLFLKNFPRFKQQQGNQPAFDAVAYTGQWTGAGGNYEINLTSSDDKKSGTGRANNARLTLKFDGDMMIFDR